LLEITDSAITDIQKAVDWYDSISNQLGSRFISSTNKAFNTLTINPYFQIRHRYYRCLRLKKFPFMVHFVVIEENRIVRVAAVLHTSKNPDSWPEVAL
jgi:hypothetical protein